MYLQHPQFKQWLRSYFIFFHVVNLISLQKFYLIVAKNIWAISFSPELWLITPNYEFNYFGCYNFETLDQGKKNYIVIVIYKIYHLVEYTSANAELIMRRFYSTTISAALIGGRGSADGR